MDYRQLMQAKLDGQLEPEAELELQKLLKAKPEALEEQAKLEAVHQTLTTAPHMRAPKRLAATIMARLAQTLEAQTKLQPMTEEVRMALMFTMQIVEMAMMPVMLAACYMVLKAAYNPMILSRVMDRTIALMMMMIDGLLVLLDEVEEMIKKDPDTARVAMALIPVALLGMLDYLQEESAEQEQG
jgi:hypothetical protein